MKTKEITLSELLSTDFIIVDNKMLGTFTLDRINMISDVLKQQKEEIERLNNIIKDARQYIQVNCILSDEWTEIGFCKFIPTGKITIRKLTPREVKELLEILDKGSEK